MFLYVKLVQNAEAFYFSTILFAAIFCAFLFFFSEIALFDIWLCFMVYRKPIILNIPPKKAAVIRFNAPNMWNIKFEKICIEKGIIYQIGL